MKKQECVVPEKIHTHPMEGPWKFLEGGGGAKQRMKINWNFLGGGGGGGGKTKTFCVGSIDILWNCTIKTSKHLQKESSQ